MLEQMGQILREVLLPVLAVAGIGAAAQRYRPMNLQTLSRLNIYVFVPAFLFVRVSECGLSLGEIGRIGVAVLAPMAAVGAAVWWGMRKRGVAGPTVAAAVASGLFFNAANFGIPVAELAFGKAGGAVEALVVMFLNTTVFFMGYVILTSGKGQGLGPALDYFKLPMAYVIALALGMRQGGWSLPGWADHAVRTVAAGMVPVALVTLGAQLAERPRWPRWKLTAGVMAVKLAVLPAATAVSVWTLGLWPWPGAQLILASAGPTAVNILLLALEVEGDAEVVADAVFWTTLASAVSVTAVLTIVKQCGGGVV